MSSVSRFERFVFYATPIAVLAFTAVVTVQSRLALRTKPDAPDPERAAVGTDAPEQAGWDSKVLKVCADPNNLPFTNDRGEGFENRLAALVAQDLGRRVEYYWQPQRRGFLRTTIQSHYCDVVMGVPAGLERVSTTRPYYRSSYVFVTRRDRGLRLRSFDDRRLHQLRIGVQLVGEDYENPPPAHALAARHIFDLVKGYTVYGDYSQPNPQSAIVHAVAAGTLDVAVVWGPIAGYFSARESVPLALTAVERNPRRDLTPFAFDIAIAVRRDDRALHEAIETALAHRAVEIARTLHEFGVPAAAPERKGA